MAKKFLIFVSRMWEPSFQYNINAVGCYLWSEVQVHNSGCLVI